MEAPPPIQPLTCPRCGSFVTGLIDAYGVWEVCAECLEHVGGPGFAAWVREPHTRISGWARPSWLSAQGCIVVLTFPTGVGFVIWSCALTIQGGLRVGQVVIWVITAAWWLIAIAAWRRLQAGNLLADLHPRQPGLIGLRGCSWIASRLLADHVWLPLGDVLDARKFTIDGTSYVARLMTSTDDGRRMAALARLVKERDA